MSDTTTDLRERIGAVGSTPTAVAAPEYFQFAELPPTEATAAGSRTWIARAQNLVLAYSQLAAADPLTRTGQPHEYMVVVPFEGAQLTVDAGDEHATVAGPAIVVVPPGDSSISVDTATELFRLFDHRTTDLAEASINAASYAQPHAHVAPLEPWPDPPGGHRLRVYPLADVPKVEGRFGRIYRTSSLMINYFYPTSGPRATNRLSPHHHDDFEQIGLVLRGECVHHIRTPWGKDMAEWRDDEHVTVGSPSMVVIPPPTVHTTQSISTDEYVHFDIFSPPRVDFSSQPGWVLNADDYPAPEGLSFEGSVDR